jgi:hypothetical protein
MMMIMSQRIVRRNLKREKSARFVARKSLKIVKRKSARRMIQMMRKSRQMSQLRNIHQVKKVAKRRIEEIVKNVHLAHLDIKLLKKNSQKMKLHQLRTFVSN